MRSLRRLVALAVLGGTFLIAASRAADAGMVFTLGPGLTGGGRWDAAPRTHNGNERSLDGGLRYAVEGRSYEAFRDQLTWNVVPTVAEFQLAMEQAFAAWTSVDAATGLGTNLSFVSDFGTPVANGSNGAEIDLFARDLGDAVPHSTSLLAVNTLSSVTLTSGTTNYGGPGNGGGGPIVGVDIIFNSNPGAVFSLDYFRRRLTHELGMAIGILPADISLNTGFVDDNYDGSTAATAAATLSNSWANLVNPFDPSASVGLTRYLGVIADGDPGLDSPGVNLLMERDNLGISAGNPLTNLIPLTNDEYGTRQFLYPVVASVEPVPEPASWALFSLVILGTAAARRRRGTASSRRIS